MADELNFKVPIKLNSFGETIRRIEAERLAEAQAAIADGWTEEDHPAECCPPETKPPQPKRSGRSIEEIERLRRKAENKAKWWADAANRAQAELDRRDASRPQFDHGMLNMPVAPRAREASAGDRIWRDMEYRKQRAEHFRHLEKKYAAQLEKKAK